MRGILVLNWEVGRNLKKVLEIGEEGILVLNWEVGRNLSVRKEFWS